MGGAQRQEAALGILLLGLFAVCLPKVADAQFYYQQPNAGIRRVPARGSVSRANSNAFEREVDFGPVEFTEGVSNSRQVTKSNGGARNGGITSASRSNAISRGANIGGLDIGGTLTRSQTRTNGAVSRGVAYDFNVGNVGLGASLSPTNLQNGFGLQRDANGGVSLGLGLLNLDLNRNANQNNAALTQAQVNAQGRNARVRANSGSDSQTQQYGNVGVTTTQSHSAAVGRTRFGQTSANTGGLSNNLVTNAGGQGGFYRPTPFAAPNYGAPFRQRSKRELGTPVDSYYNEPFVGLQQAQQRRYPTFPPHPMRKRPIFISQQNKSLEQHEQEDTTELTELRRSRGYNSRAQTPAPNNAPPAANNPATATEQFDVIDENQRQARTFSFITDFINSLTPCVTPCTLEAYQQNKCCVLVDEPTTCCNTPPYQPPFPQPIPPRQPPIPPRQPPPFIPPQQPIGPPIRPPIYSYLQPINCCIVCTNYGFYGPPPCTRYGTGGLYSNGGATLGSGTTTLTNFGSSATNFGTNLISNPGQTVSVFLPPTRYG